MASLRELRRRRLLSQRELATAVGVRFQTVQMWEQGKNRPRPAQQRKLVEALRVTPDELLAALDETGLDAKEGE